VHGATIVDMVRKIEAATVGLTVADDPKCSKIRTEMTKRLSALSQAQRQASRDFDRVELGQGGNLQKLILALVNGG
jgi:predicted secreted Zn-dependent protease